jgi:DNA-directed RNA polymerase specialized sigma24 family protein
MDWHGELASAMDRYAEGDDAGLCTVYDMLAPRLLGFFAEHGCPPARCEEFVQQTLIEMHTSRRWYARGSDVESWALALAGRVIAADRRARVPRREGVLSRTCEALRALLARRQPQTVPEASK